MASVPVFRRIGNAFAAFRANEVKSSGGYFDELLALLSQARDSKAGVSVSLETALKVTTVFAVCRVISEGIAGMPWKLQRRFDNGGREFATDMPLFQILYRRPNDWQTSFEFREMLMFHALLTGNGYAYINRDGAGRVTELLPIVPNRVKPHQDKDTIVTYKVRDSHGVLQTIPRKDMFHLRGPAWDGLHGIDAVALARDAIGLAISAEETQSDFQRNGLQASGIISFQESLKPPTRERLKERIKEMKDDANQMGVLILDQAAKFEKMTQTGVDAQLLETRRFQIEEICRVFRVFPQMIGHAERAATYASAEQFFLAHVIHTLMPWVQRWEEAAQRDLIADDAVEGDYELIAKMSMQGLMRGDAATRAAFYASGIVNGWLTRADAREFEDLPAIPLLDKPLMPLNMIVVGEKPPAVPGAAGPGSAGATAQNDKNAATKMQEVLAKSLGGHMSAEEQVAAIGDILREHGFSA